MIQLQFFRHLHSDSCTLSSFLGVSNLVLNYECSLKLLGKSRAGIRSFAKAMIMIACIAMYIMAIAHYFLVFRDLLVTSNGSTYLIENASACVIALGDTLLKSNSSDPLPCVAVPEGAAIGSSTIGGDCTPSILLLINVRTFIFMSSALLFAHYDSL